MSLYNKPSYIPSEFLKATKQGWVDIRTGEVLVAIANLDTLVKTEVVVEEVAQAEPIIENEVSEPISTEEDEPTKPKRKPKQQ